MSLYPKDAVEIEVSGATVAFMKYEKDGVVYIQFDSSKSGHPEPMINAMSGLQVLQDREKLEMINSKAPMGLFPKIEEDFNFEIEELADGRVKTTFIKRANGEAKTDFTATSCSGGGCQN
ncbi:hypothetical protein MNB_ARC-1_96 [hydrothermal vent metagenome]|uniref:DUF2249 domain-containing protein n=1 Tax=hydrothermal vent metagenome TaxID=652676 RepID=A0A3B1E9E0_9ZZZZ